MKSLARLRVDMYIDKVNELSDTRKLKLKRMERGEYWLCSYSGKNFLSVLFVSKSFVSIENVVTALYIWELDAGAHHK